MKKEKKIIHITCRGAAWLRPDQFEAFQGGMKSLSEEDYQKLKKAILDKGFSFPVFVWRDGRTFYIVDGHQRLLAVLRMIDEGWTVQGGKLPVDWIEARNRKEAKEKLLLAMSQYGKYTEKSLMEYIDDAGLDLGEINLTIDLPGIDIDGILGKREKGKNKPEVEFATELLEAHNYIVLYFDNEVDWLQAQTLFGLKRVKALHWTEKFQSVGLGRVVKGSEAIEKMRGMK
jgi:hypothetical protein